MVAQEVLDEANDLEQLKRRFEQFLSLRTSRGRLPQTLWKEAAKTAKRHVLIPTAQALRLEYNRLKKHLTAKADPVKRKKEDADPFSGYLFVFRSRRATSIRILTYDSRRSKVLNMEARP